MEFVRKTAVIQQVRAQQVVQKSTTNPQKIETMESEPNPARSLMEGIILFLFASARQTRLAKYSDEFYV